MVSDTMQAASRELGIDVDIRYTKRDYPRALAITRDFLSRRSIIWSRPTTSARAARSSSWRTARACP